jgi:hypothetical protein
MCLLAAEQCLPTMSKLSRPEDLVRFEELPNFQGIPAAFFEKRL